MSNKYIRALGRASGITIRFDELNNVLQHLSQIIAELEQEYSTLKQSVATFDAVVQGGPETVYNQMIGEMQSRIGVLAEAIQAEAHEIYQFIMYMNGNSWAAFQGLRGQRVTYADFRGGETNATLAFSFLPPIMFLPDTFDHQISMAELQKASRYRRSADEAGISPLLLGMIVENEIDSRFYEKFLPADLIYNVFPHRTFGSGQVMLSTAIDMYEAYPERFEDVLPASVYNDDGSFNELHLARELKDNEDLNILTSATYVGHLQDTITNDLTEMGLVVSDTPIDGQVAVTSTQVEQMTVISYQAKWSRFSDSLNSNYDTAQARYDAFVNTIDANQGQLDRVYGHQEEVKDLLDPPDGVTLTA